MLKSFHSSVCKHCKPSHKYLSKPGSLTDPLTGIMWPPIPFCPELNYHHKKSLKSFKSRIPAALGNLVIFSWVNRAEIPVQDQNSFVFSLLSYFLFHEHKMLCLVSLLIRGFDLCAASDERILYFCPKMRSVMRDGLWVLSLPWHEIFLNCCRNVEQHLELSWGWLFPARSPGCAVFAEAAGTAAMSPWDPLLPPPLLAQPALGCQGGLGAVTPHCCLCLCVWGC